jgi:ABC-2 type transport system permease protein
MAIIFLMFTVTLGGRSILAERDWGTLPRLLTTPCTPAQVLGGKVAGIFFTGTAQMAILILAGAVLFNLKWGSPIGVTVLTLSLVAAATSWGMLLAAYARSAAQANQIGSALAVVFAGLAGNFIPRSLLPGWLQTVSYITPNAWGLEGFIKLSAGGTLADVIGPIVALWIMAGIVFGIALVAFRRQYSR